jgi:hypothetical protein
MKTPKRLLLLCALGACEGLTTPPSPALSALKRMPEGCFALMTPATPVAPDITLNGLCSYQADPSLMAGVDEAVVVVDYGPDVEFDTTTAIPPPIVTLTVDGAVSDTPISISAPQRIGARAYFLATLRAPEVISQSVAIDAEVNAGFHASLDNVFSLVPAPISLGFAECPDPMACVLPGAVGDAHLQISVPGSVEQTVTVRTAVDGIEQPDAVVVDTHPDGTASSATVALPVPAAHVGAMWTASAQLPVGPAPSVTAAIQSPAVTMQLSCAPNCSLSPGDSVGLAIFAPKGVRADQALVTTRVDGVPQLVAEPVALIEDSASSSALVSLTVPSQCTWTIDATVAGYSAPAIVQTIP